MYVGMHSGPYQEVLVLRSGVLKISQGLTKKHFRLRRIFSRESFSFFYLKHVILASLNYFRQPIYGDQSNCLLRKIMRDNIQFAFRAELKIQYILYGPQILAKPEYSAYFTNNSRFLLHTVVTVILCLGIQHLREKNPL